MTMMLGTKTTRTTPTLAALSLAVICGAMVTGCQPADTIKGPYVGRADQLPQENYPHVTIDGHLARWIAVSQPIVEKSDVMKVTVPVRLVSDRGESSNAQYRILFLNSTGTPARGGDMAWRFLNLPARNQVFLTANSMDSDAVDYRCEIRVAK